MHVIRLKRPWEKTCLAIGQSQIVDVPEPGIANRDTTESGPGQSSYSRNFNAPSGLESTSRVYLRVSQWAGKLDRVCLNGRVIDAVSTAPLELDITASIQRHNRIEIVLEDLPAQLAGMTGEVTIAIDDE